MLVTTGPGTPDGWLVPKDIAVKLIYKFPINSEYRSPMVGNNE